jgi:hypothetical protein
MVLNLSVRETYIRQNYGWSAEAQVDWCEAYAELAGERVKLQVLAMRSMASGAAFMAPTDMRPSRRFWKGMNSRSRTSAMCFESFGTTSCRNSDVQRTLNWVRLASRFPVRVRITNPSPELFRVSGFAVVIVLREVSVWPRL